MKKVICIRIPPLIRLEERPDVRGRKGVQT